jgi:hypothetical protein
VAGYGSPATRGLVNQKLNWVMFDASKTVGGPSTTEGPVVSAAGNTL